MKSVVIYGSRTGNTRRIAEAIHAVLAAQGESRLLSVEEAAPSLAREAELLVVGGPTEGHGITEPVNTFLEALGVGSLTGTAVVAFDTRLHWPRWLSGSAAATIASRLEHAGGRLLVPAESFIVSMKPELEPGELERATAWACELVERLVPVGGSGRSR